MGLTEARYGGPSLSGFHTSALEIGAKDTFAVVQAAYDKAGRIGLTDEEGELMLHNGKQPVFCSRLHWTKFRLKPGGPPRFVIGDDHLGNRAAFRAGPELRNRRGLGGSMGTKNAIPNW